MMNASYFSPVHVHSLSSFSLSSDSSISSCLSCSTHSSFSCFFSCTTVALTVTMHTMLNVNKHNSMLLCMMKLFMLASMTSHTFNVLLLSLTSTRASNFLVFSLAAECISSTCIFNLVFSACRRLTSCSNSYTASFTNDHLFSFADPW